jgi:methionyl-tRNA formyltransferase
VRLLLVTGDSPRHVYLHNKLCGLGIEIIWVIENRHNSISKKNMKIDGTTKVGRIYSHHLKDWKESESHFFGIPSFDSETSFRISVESSEVNSPENIRKFAESEPDVILSYGCSKLSEDFLKIPNCKKLNVHGGLSPWYRGTITNFWPSYLLEPQFTGLTLHETDNRIDGGDVIFQTAVQLESKDGVNQNSCRATRQFIDELVSRLQKSPEKLRNYVAVPQTTSGRIWTNSMWTPHHLFFIYESMNNKVNDYCKRNNLLTRTPKLFDGL